MLPFRSLETEIRERIAHVVISQLQLATPVVSVPVPSEPNPSVPIIQRCNHGDTCCCEVSLLQTEKIRTLPRLRVLDPKHRLGPHVSIQSTILKTLSQPGLIRCRCSQFFLGSPRTKITRTISQPEKEQICTYCDQYNMSFYIHCPYVANFAKPDFKEAQASVNVVLSQLRSLGGLPAACVLHIGKVGTIENVATRINDLHVLNDLQGGNHHKAPRRLLLENAAGQGTELGRTWDELRKLFEAIDTNKVGLCLDTQHLFASGMSPLSNHEDVVRLFDNAEAICPGGLRLIHLNDSDREFGTRVDRHMSIRFGHIWYRNDESLRAIIERCHETGLDMVLETPSQSSDLGMLKRNYGC
jgi:deoxyribonuclease-4